MIGDKEKQAGKVAIRRRGEDLGQMTVAEFIAYMQQEIATTFAH